MTEENAPQEGQGVSEPRASKIIARALQRWLDRRVRRGHGEDRLSEELRILIQHFTKAGDQ